MKMDAAAYDRPLDWLKSLGDEEFLTWLRQSVQLGRAAPFQVPEAADLGLALSRCLGEDVEILLRTKSCLPLLVREWDGSVPANASSLRTLLNLCASLRCVGCEPAIANVIQHRVAHRSDKVELRKYCLSVLSGFGALSPQSVRVLQAYMTDIEYSATCYRGLARDDFRLLVNGMPQLIEAHKRAGKASILLAVMRLVFTEDVRNDSQRLDIVREILAANEHDEDYPLEDVLTVLEGAIGLQFVEREGPSVGDWKGSAFETSSLEVHMLLPTAGGATTGVKEQRMLGAVRVRSMSLRAHSLLIVHKKCRGARTKESLSELWQT